MAGASWFWCEDGLAGDVLGSRHGDGRALVKLCTSKEPAVTVHQGTSLPYPRGFGFFGAVAVPSGSACSAPVGGTWVNMKVMS